MYRTAPHALKVSIEGKPWCPRIAKEETWGEAPWTWRPPVAATSPGGAHKVQEELEEAGSGPWRMLDM